MKTFANIANDTMVRRSTTVAIVAAMLIAAVLVLPMYASAQTMMEESEMLNGRLLPETLEERVRSYNVDALLWATLLLVILVGVAILGSSGGRELPDKLKTILFWGIALVAGGSTLFLATVTIYLNVVSVTGGPVHWHADFRIFACDQEIDLKDPSGFSNKIGTPVLHEHGDFRIHVEGVVVKEREAHLGTFFDVIGGELTETSMMVPTNDGLFAVRNGDVCPDGSVGALQAFVWETSIEENPSSGQEIMVARQHKLNDVSRYLMNPETIVPPGDCIIVEFGPERDQTDHVCLQYEVAESRDEMRIER